MAIEKEREFSVNFTNFVNGTPRTEEEILTELKIDKKTFDELIGNLAKDEVYFSNGRWQFFKLMQFCPACGMQSYEKPCKKSNRIHYTEKEIMDELQVFGKVKTITETVRPRKNN